MSGITDVDGIKVGHYTDEANGTGCTAVLCERGAVGGVDVGAIGEPPLASYAFRVLAG